MILIIGTSEDDILFFKSKARNIEEITYNDHYKIIFGDICDQRLCFAYGVNTNYMSATFTSYLIQKYSIILAINVGLARGFSDDLKCGDIVISKRINLVDVDQINVDRVKLAQIPNAPQFINCNSYLVEVCSAIVQSLAISGVYTGSLFSSNSFYTKKSDLGKATDGRVVLGLDDHLILDCEAGGMAASCTFYDIPFVSIKVVTYVLDRDVYNRDYMLKALKSYTKVGKLVSAVVSEVSRKDTYTF